MIGIAEIIVEEKLAGIACLLLCIALEDRERIRQLLGKKGRARAELGRLSREQIVFLINAAAEVVNQTEV